MPHMLRYIKTGYVKVTCSSHINTNSEKLPHTNFKRLVISTLLSTNHKNVTRPISQDPFLLNVLFSWDTKENCNNLLVTRFWSVYSHLNWKPSPQYFFLTYRRTFTSLPGRAAMLSFAARGRATNESNTKQSSLNLFPNIQLLNESWFELKI